MRNLTLTWLAVALIFVASCKKENGTKIVNDENTFTIDGKSYVATKVFYNESDNIIMAQRVVPGTGLNEVESVSITFSDSDLPTSGGNFKIVSNPYSPGNTTNNDEVSIIATVFPYDYGSYVDDNSFVPNLSPTQNVIVSINSNNKVNVKFTNIAVKDGLGKSTTISGNITQP